MEKRREGQNRIGRKEDDSDYKAINLILIQ